MKCGSRRGGFTVFLLGIIGVYFLSILSKSAMLFKRTSAPRGKEREPVSLGEGAAEDRIARDLGRGLSEGLDQLDDGKLGDVDILQEGCGQQGPGPSTSRQADPHPGQDDPGFGQGRHHPSWALPHRGYGRKWALGQMDAVVVAANRMPGMQTLDSVNLAVEHLAKHLARVVLVLQRSSPWAKIYNAKLTAQASIVYAEDLQCGRRCSLQGLGDIGEVATTALLQAW